MKCVMCSALISLLVSCPVLLMPRAFAADREKENVQADASGAKTTAISKELDSLKSQYLKALGALTTERDTKLSKLAKEYVSALEILQKDTAARGELDAALAVKTEKERVSSNKETTEEDKEKMPSWLLTQRNKFELDLDQI